MSIDKYDVGDKVVCNPDEVSAAYCGTVYTLVQKLKVNVVLDPVGGGKRLKINPANLLPAPPDGEPVAAMGVPYREPLATGTVVTVAGLPGVAR